MMDTNEARRYDMEEAEMEFNFDQAVKRALESEFKSCVLFQIIEGHDLVITETGVFHYEMEDGKLELYVMGMEEKPFKSVDI